MNGRTTRLLGSVLVLVIAIIGILFSAQARVPTGGPTMTPRAGTAIPGSNAPTVTATLLAPTATPNPSQRPSPTPTATAANRPTATPTPASRGQPTPAANDNLPVIQFAALPPQAQETIRLIDRGGPFPYDRDGITFGNRERLLPIRADGYYREYTVITPGSSDRGARRIVAGRGGELYYTDDHYESFRRVVRP